MISFTKFDEYIRDFKKEQEEKGVLSPFKQQKKIRAGLQTRIGDTICIRDMTPEESKLYAYWGDRIPEWLLEEEKYCVERIYAEFGYADAMEYAFGQYRKSGLKEFFEDLRPCDYGDNCNMFCKKFIDCKGELM